MPIHTPAFLHDSAVLAAEGGPDDSLAGEVLDTSGLDWGRIYRARYLLHQNITYTYPNSISDLRHRLLVLPPARHGDQFRIAHRLSITGAPVVSQSRFDGFGNLVIDVHAPRVAEQIDFKVSIAVERNAADGPLRLPTGVATDVRLLEPTPLTEPDPTLRKAAERLKGAASGTFRSGFPGKLTTTRRLGLTGVEYSVGMLPLLVSKSRK